MSAPSRSRRKTDATAAAAVRAVVQMLAATGKRYTVDGLREKLREFFREEGNSDLRAVASLSSVQLITHLLEANEKLALSGLQVRLVNGMVSLGTTRVENPRLAEYLAREAPGDSAVGGLTPAMLEVLACVAFQQPLGQAEIDRLFGNTDKRAAVAKLREMGLIEDFPGPQGRLQFATTTAFLERFSLTSLEDLRAQLG